MVIQTELYQKSQSELIKLINKEYHIRLVSFLTISKLLEVGKIVVDSLWNNQDIMAQNYTDMQQYHFVLVCLCFEAGVNAASLWKENNDCFNDESVLEMIKNPSPQYARGIVQQTLDINDFQLQLLYSQLYDKYKKQIKPFLGKEVADDGIKTVLLSINQLGAYISLY